MVRPALILSGAAVVLLASAFWLGARYADGRAAIRQQAAIEAALSAYAEQQEKERPIVAEGLQAEQQIVERIRYVERQIPVVETPDCTDLGAEWLGLFNDAIDAASP